MLGYSQKSQTLSATISLTVTINQFTQIAEKTFSKTWTFKASKAVPVADLTRLIRRALQFIASILKTLIHSITLEVQLAHLNIDRQAFPTEEVATSTMPKYNKKQRTRKRSWLIIKSNLWMNGASKTKQQNACLKQDTKNKMVPKRKRIWQPKKSCRDFYKLKTEVVNETINLMI